MVKLKRSPKKPELDINVAKWAIPRFSAASSELGGKQRIPRRGVKIHVPQNTAGPDHHRQH